MANMANTAAYKGPDGRMTVDVDSNKTLAAADNGFVQNVIADAITITLPSTALGLCYNFRNGGVPATSGPTGTGSNGTVLLTVAPAAADGISTFSNLAAANNKAALNTKATSNVGDSLTLIGTGTAGVTGWNILQMSGTWVRQT